MIFKRNFGAVAAVPQKDNNTEATLPPVKSGRIKNKKIRKSAGPISWFCTILALLIWSAGLGLVSLYYATADYGDELFISYFENNRLWLYNMLPVLVFVAVLFFLTNRAWLTMLISGCAVFSLTAVNYLKLVLRSDPLLASDIFYINEAANIGAGYDMVLPEHMLKIFAAAAVLAILSILLLRGRFSGKYAFQRRMVFLFISVLCSVAIGTEIYRSDALYASTVNLDVKLKDRDLSKWSGTDLYVSRGFIYPLIYSGCTYSEKRPEGYTKAAAGHELREYGYDDIPEDKKVSVISVMLEAFSDLSGLYDIPAETDPYVLWHELQQEGVSGNLVTNIFAGGTIDTERGFITGMTEYYDFRKATGSYARYFSEQGYFTEFCHPGLPWFYNRKNVTRYLGFESGYFLDNRYTPIREDWPINDYLFFPDLIDLFTRRADHGTPYFNFSVTYQNHGPYNDSTIYGGKEFISNTGFSDASYNIINNYFNGIANTSEVLYDFVGYFRTADEPVILVFFGDHKPWLGDNNSVYLELGMDIFLDSNDGFYNYFTTPYLIWANDSAKAVLGNDFTGYGGDMSPCFLMSEVFKRAGWGGDEFMKASAELRETIDIVHADGNRRENGELVPILSDEGRELLLKFKNLQYYRKNDQYK